VYGGEKDLEGRIDLQGRPRGMEMTFFVLDKEYWDGDALLAEYVHFIWNYSVHCHGVNNFIGKFLVLSCQFYLLLT